MKRIGSRAQVMHGTAKMTSGGLLKKHLKYNKQGKIVSKKASRAAKKSKNLIKAGYITKKGKFGAVKVKKGGVKTEEVIRRICETDMGWREAALLISDKILAIVKKREGGFPIGAHSLEKKISQVDRLLNELKIHPTCPTYTTNMLNILQNVANKVLNNHVMNDYTSYKLIKYYVHMILINYKRTNRTNEANKLYTQILEDVQMNQANSNIKKIEFNELLKRFEELKGYTELPSYRQLAERLEKLKRR